MIRALTTSEKLSRIDELLEARYASAPLGNKKDPLDELIYILLSIQTQAAGFNRSYDALRKIYPSWRAVLDAPTASLVRILKPSGLARQKAPRLKAILSKILRDARAIAAARGADPDRLKEPSLSFLAKLSDEDAESYLLSLPGVGPKTARCVLMYSLKRAVFPVDINVYRVFTRLGIVARLPWKRAHDPYQGVVPLRMRHRLHVNLVHLGREVCKPVRPKCHECSLISFCKTGLAQHRHKPKNGRIAVDLFSGAGSLSAGFKAAGWGILFAADIDRPAAQTYRYNHSGTPVFETDVARLTAAEVLSVIGRRKGQIDAVIGGPPCQGYSAAGKRLPHAPTNYLYRPFATLARNLGARLVLMENVPGVQQVNGTGFVPRILAHFRRLGYSADSFLLNAAQYGVPQERRRLIFIGLAKRLGLGASCPPAEFADPQVKRSGLPKAPTIRDVMKGLPRIQAGGGAEVLARPEGKLYNHWSMKHSRRVVAKIKRIPRGKGPISYKRLTWRYAGTLIAGHRALPVHPGVARTITVREAARIQTIPDSYRFLGPRWLQPLQVADAVPFLLARVLAKNALQLLGAGRQRLLNHAINSARSVRRHTARLKGLAGQVLHAA